MVSPPLLNDRRTLAQWTHSSPTSLRDGPKDLFKKTHLGSQSLRTTETPFSKGSSNWFHNPCRMVEGSSPKDIRFSPWSSQTVNELSRRESTRVHNPSRPVEPSPKDLLLRFVIPPNDRRIFQKKNPLSSQLLPSGRGIFKGFTLASQLCLNS